jgi:hypothetical protein
MASTQSGLRREEAKSAGPRPLAIEKSLEQPVYRAWASGGSTLTRDRSPSDRNPESDLALVLARLGAEQLISR